MINLNFNVTQFTRKISSFFQTKQKSSFDPYAVFHEPIAHAINQARLNHLASLGLDLHGKKVLEVGAGIGMLTPFFRDRGCDILVTDGREENLIEAKRRSPDLKTAILDLESCQSLEKLGHFDIIFCYGLLYHLGNPERALKCLADVCDGFLLLETMVSPSDKEELILTPDPNSFNQAVSGSGCRPSRLWIIKRLKALMGNAYISVTQPDYVDFPTDWVNPPVQMNYRAIFVGSRKPISFPTVTENIPLYQDKYMRTW